MWRSDWRVSPTLVACACPERYLTNYRAETPDQEAVRVACIKALRVCEARGPTLSRRPLDREIKIAAIHCSDGEVIARLHKALRSGYISDRDFTVTQRRTLA